MRKWQDLAAPDDPGSWNAVSNMIPTQRGTYQTGPTTVAFSETATGTGNVIYAFIAPLLSGTRTYVVDDAGHIWENTGTPLTDRTGGVTVGADVMMAQFGTATIAVMGTANATVASTGGNFAAVAAAPKGRIICIQSNIVLIFNTNTSADGWASSDAGDHTNWTTGEASSGRIFATPGPITAAVPFGNDVIVFKADAIYRMTYVGGSTIKWQIQLIWKGLGCAVSRFNVCATPLGVAFNGKAAAITEQDGTAHHDVYIFDGASPPKMINPLTTISYGTSGQESVYSYDSQTNVMCISPAFGSNASGLDGNGNASRYFYYHVSADMWGAGNGDSAEGTTTGNGVLQGQVSLQTSGVSRPNFWAKSAANTLKQVGTLSAQAYLGSVAPDCYLQTKKIGSFDLKTQFDRLTVMGRRRTNISSGSASLSFELFRELEDTSAQSTRTVAEATNRKRFDLSGGANVDCFGRFKVTWTGLDVEVDDFKVKTKSAGAE